MDDALYEAVGCGNWKRVRGLLCSGANVNQDFGSGWTPLLWAAYNGHLRICQILFEYGADPQSGAQYEWGALSFAGKRGRRYHEITKLFLAHGVPGDDLLPYAVTGNTATVRMLLKRGAKPNGMYVEQTFLNLARNARIVRLLLKYGADPLVHNENGEHALHYCANWGWPARLQALLEGGCPANLPEPGPEDRPDIGEAYALHYACERGHVRCVRILLEHGADPELTSTFHKPALLLAVERGSPEMVRMLLERGANPLRVYEGESAHAIAVAKLAKSRELTVFHGNRMALRREAILAMLETNPQPL